MAHPTLADGIEFQAAGDELLVHDPQSRKIHVLNATAGAVLQACDGTRDLEALAKIVWPPDWRAAYDDTRTIVTQFSDLGLLRVEA